MMKKIKTKEAFECEWTIFGKINDLYDSEDRLFAEFSRYKIPRSFFQNKVILDAGCGMGRYSYVAAKLGAKLVVGLDMHDSVIYAKENCKGLEVEFVKKITTRSQKIALFFSFTLLVLSKIPLLRKLLLIFFEVSGKKPWKRALADIFDWYHAPVTTFHDEDEMKMLYKECSFEKYT